MPPSSGEHGIWGFAELEKLKVPEVGDLNALKIVKKLAELGNKLSTARVDAIGEAIERLDVIVTDWHKYGMGDKADAGDYLVTALEQLKGEDQDPDPGLTPENNQE